MNKNIILSLVLLSSFNHASAMKKQAIHTAIEKSITELIAKPAERKKRRLLKTASATLLVQKHDKKTNMTRTISAPVFTQAQKFKFLVRAIKDNKQASVKMYACEEIINRADSEQRTPLMWAAFFGNNGTIVDLLLKAGADPNRTNKNGNTPLHLALLQHEINPGIVQMLIDAGTRLHLENTNGKTALQLLKKKRKECPTLKNITLPE